MENTNIYTRHTYSYLSLRKAVGWIGMLLPFVLMLGVFIIFNENVVQESISHYYYTGMRNVFVGALCAVALFLFFYCGYDSRDNYLGNLAGFCAIGVALFPTTEVGPSDWIGNLHFIFAALFFVSLAIFSLFLFTISGDNPTPQKKTRNGIYILCGIIMLACLLFIVIYFNCFEQEGGHIPLVFWAETIALVAFGISWLTKGGTFLRDKE